MRERGIGRVVALSPPAPGFIGEGHTAVTVVDLNGVDLLNAFNTANYTDYIVSWGQNGVPNPEPVKYNTVGNIGGVPRTLKASLGVKF